MGKKKDLVNFIIPVHQVVDSLRVAVKSISDLEKSTIEHKIFIACIQDVFDKLHDQPEYKDVSFVVEKDSWKTSYQELVNCAIDNIKLSKDSNNNDWIYILEYDDEILPKALKVFKEFKEYKEADIYAPISLVVENSEGSSTKKLLALQNEAAWAQGLSEEHGFIDFNMMLRMNFLFVNGCFISLKVIEDYGAFKPEIKNTFDYEFALRMVYNGVIIFAIPRAVHYHYTSNSGYSGIFKKMPQDERDFWVSLARKEYFYEDVNPRYKDRENFSFKAK
jgi:hypothetical protein